MEDGWPWPMHEGTDPMAEYEAVRTGTGIWDLFSTSKYEVTGPDAGAADPAPVHELARRHAGRPVRYGAFVNADGKMIDDGNVYKLADDKYWVMINTADIEDWFRETADGLDAHDRAHRTEDFGDDRGPGPDRAGAPCSGSPTATWASWGTSASGPRRRRSPASRRMGAAHRASAARRGTRSSWRPRTRRRSGTR